MNKILVSIITVCKNPGKDLHETFYSVVNQRYQNIEYIIIDGESNDDTVSWLQKPEQRYYIKHFISEKDNGIYSAINKGILLSKGHIIGILHAGDKYPESSIEKVVSIFLKNKNSIIAGGIRILYNNKFKDYFLKNHSVKELDHNMSLFHPSVFIPKKHYQTYGLYNENFQISGDFDLLRRFYKNKVKFKTTGTILSKMQYGGVSTQPSSAIIIANEKGKIIIEGNGLSKWLKTFNLYVKVIFEVNIQYIRNLISNFF